MFALCVVHMHQACITASNNQNCFQYVHTWGAPLKGKLPKVSHTNSIRGKNAWRLSHRCLRGNKAMKFTCMSL